MSAAPDEILRLTTPHAGRGTRRADVWAHSRRDALLVLLSFLQSAALLAVPSILMVAMALWWCANTVAHNFIHAPFFRPAAANRAYSLYLSILLGFPQGVWRSRHLAHHEGRAAVATWSEGSAIELAAIATLWGLLIGTVPAYFFGIYLPGCLLGLALCFLQGYFEHAPETTSHYGRIYNTLFFNDGYHCEHHAAPHTHWTALPAQRRALSISRWPPVLRWLAPATLDLLEQAALRSSLVRAWLLRTHEAAIRRLLPRIGGVATITIIGGGLFPRSAMVCRRLFPQARIRIVDASAANLATAGMLLGDNPVEYMHAKYPACRGSMKDEDLVLVPLALRGCREEIYADPPGRACLVHDWVWSRRPGGAVISLLLLKRINLIHPA